MSAKTRRPKHARTKKPLRSRRRGNFVEVDGHKMPQWMHAQYEKNLRKRGMQRGGDKSLDDLIRLALADTVQPHGPMLRAKELLLMLGARLSTAQHALWQARDWPWVCDDPMLRKPAHGLLLDAARELQAIARQAIEFEKVLTEDEGAELFVQDWLLIDARLAAAALDDPREAQRRLKLARRALPPSAA